MPKIIMNHQLPGGIPPGTILTSSAAHAFGNKYLDEEYLPVGGAIAVPKDLTKLRVIESLGGDIVERYGYVRKIGDDRGDDICVPFMRILSPNNFAKVITNKGGTRRAINELNVFIPEAMKPDTKSTTLFTGDIVLSNEHETVLPVSDSRNWMCEYYQTDQYDTSGLGLHESPQTGLGPIESYIDHMRACEQIGNPCMDLSLQDDALCDTGGISKIDSMSWMSRHGDLSINEVRRSLVDADARLVLPQMDIPEYDQLLDLRTGYHLVHLLQMCPMTDADFHYILLEGRLTIDSSSYRDVYQFTTTEIHQRYISLLGSVLELTWPQASYVHVDLSYYHDALITVNIGDMMTTYYVDLLLAGILTRNLIHL